MLACRVSIRQKPVIKLIIELVSRTLEQGKKSAVLSGLIRIQQDMLFFGIIAIAGNPGNRPGFSGLIPEPWQRFGAIRQVMKSIHQDILLLIRLWNVCFRFIEITV